MTTRRLQTLVRTVALAVSAALLVVACVGGVGTAPQQPDRQAGALSGLTLAQNALIRTNPSSQPLVADLRLLSAPSLTNHASALEVSRAARQERAAIGRSVGSALYRPLSQDRAAPRVHLPLSAELVGPTARYVSVRSDIRIAFSRSLNRSRAERALQIEPAVSGRIDWLDERTMRFQPEKLAYGTTYKVHLEGAAPDSSTDSAWEWTFTTMKALTLSFDDCPSSTAEAQSLLAFLRQNHIRAMMFATGACNRQFAWLVPTLLADGHKVCNHTYSHAHLMRMPDHGVASEIAGGVHANCNLLRPPYGEWDGPGGRIERIAAQQGYRIQLWDVDTYDWAEASAPRMLNQINELGGGLILMHFQGRHTQEALRQLDLRDVVSVS